MYNLIYFHLYKVQKVAKLAYALKVKAIDTLGGYWILRGIGRGEGSSGELVLCFMF